jgi:hypothetical protein
MILLITYDLKGPVGTYAPLFQAIQNEGPWSHFIASTWLVTTRRTPQEVATMLIPLIKQGDFLLVTQFGRQYWGWLPKAAWDWIAQQPK